MKILLLEHPRRMAKERCNDIANTPLSSSLITGYTAGMLSSQGHEVKVVEGYLDQLPYAEVAGTVAKFAPDILGVHLVYNWDSNEELFAFLQRIKSAGIRFIAAYGFYPTFAYAEILLQCPAIDAAIIGEPEYTFAELAAEEPERARRVGMPGLAWRNEQAEMPCRRRALAENLDLLPHPVRTEAMLRLPELNVEGSRGCYGGCTFCYINAYYGRAACWRGRSPENVAAEIDSLLARYGKRSFYFVDPNFFGPGRYGRERVLRLAALLKERKIRFGIEGRVNDIAAETVSALVEAGLHQILIGLESGSNESLRRLNKMTTVEQNEQAIRILRQHGIEPSVGFIMFEPDSSLKDIRINFEFLLRNQLLNNLAVTANVLYHPQIILQGTKAYQRFRDEGRLQLLAAGYEGTVAFADRQVAALAEMMRKITNYVFLKMDGIWSGRVEEPHNAPAIYSQLNHSLIRYFSQALADLEAGKKLAGDEIEAVAAQAKKEIDLFLAV